MAEGIAIGIGPNGPRFMGKISVDLEQKPTSEIDATPEQIERFAQIGVARKELHEEMDKEATRMAAEAQELGKKYAARGGEIEGQSIAFWKEIIKEVGIDVPMRYDAKTKKIQIFDPKEMKKEDEGMIANSAYDGSGDKTAPESPSPSNSDHDGTPEGTDTPAAEAGKE